jgi:plastocyanin
MPDDRSQNPSSEMPSMTSSRIFLSNYVLGAVTILCIVFSASSAHAEKVQVDIITDAPCDYCPDPVVINEGDTVVWTNGDSTLHTAMSGTPESGPTGLFGGTLDSPKLIAPSRTLEFTFINKGEYSYYCILHPSMSGVVHVKQVKEVPRSSEVSSLNFTLDGTMYTISVASVDAILESAEINPGIGVTLHFEEPGSESVVITVPVALIGYPHQVTTEDGSAIASELISENEVEITFQISLPEGLDTVKILSGNIRGGGEVSLSGISTNSIYEAKINWRLPQKYTAEVFHIEIFDATRPEKQGPINGHYDILMYRGDVELKEQNNGILQPDQWRMFQQSVSSTEISLNMQNGDHTLVIDNINGTDEKIVIPFKVTPEFPIGLVGPAAVISAIASVVAFTRLRITIA